MLLDVSLRRLAGELGNEWRSLGTFLGLLKSQVDQCFINHPGDVKEAIVDMLVLWQQLTSDRGPESQVADLVQALKDIGRVDLAERVEDGDFIEYSDQMAGNRERPDHGAGNRVEVTGHNNFVIQAGNNANINVSVPAPITGASEPVTPGCTSLPDLSRTQPPYPIPHTFSQDTQDNSQHSMETVLNDCIRQLQEMGFSDEGSCRREVQNIISTGLRTTQHIVETFVERNQAQRTPVEQPLQPMSSSTFDSLDGRTTGGRGERGSPDPSTDVSMSDVSLQLQGGGTIQDNQASNWPETGLLSSDDDDGEEVTEEPLIDLSPESPHPNTAPVLMDQSIPSQGLDPPMPPESAVPLQQSTVEAAESRDESHESNQQLAQNEAQDENMGGAVAPSAARREQTTERESAEETVPKVPPEQANANNEAEGASDNQRPTETRQQVSEGADGDQPVYDKERRLYIFRRAHIEEMTENRSPSKEIAKGAFGPVYFLEKFPYDVNGPLKDQPMAVKVNQSEDQGQREFIQELAMAGSRHPHLLPLIGICEDEGCLALVYTYMENEDLLKRMKDQAHPLSYKQRLLIALDLISAVRYYFSTKRFHRDIKSANVLLDRNNRARLADPGLMKELPSDKTHLSQSGRSMTRCGTANYQDPYYVDTGRFHETSDQYSAGKVLLELLTGKPADAVDEDEIVLFHNWRDELDYFRDTTGKGLCEVADHSGEGWPEVTEDGNSVTQQFAKVVIGCLQSHPRKRSNLEMLYQELKNIATTAGALGSFSEVMPTMCTYCLACKPCPIPMACGCALLCTACMKSHTEALYCPKHHAKTTGLGQNTFAVIIGQREFEEDAKGFKSVITKPHICGVREENVRLLIRPTIEKVKEEVEHLAAEIEKVQEGQETFFIFYFSGHGTLQALYFQQMPLTSWKLKKICQKSKATKSLLILDACHSSSVDGYTLKGGSQDSDSEAEEEEEEEEQEHHDNTNTIQKAPQTRYAGSMVWASSLTAERSGKKGKYSVFTKYIISGLQDGKCGAENCAPCKSFQEETKVKGVVSQNHLRDFVYHHVTKEVQQTPSEVGQRMTTSWIAYAQD